MFPEGTVTSGKHIIKFKKGAFNSILPLKPLIIQSNQREDFHLSVGGESIIMHFLRTGCYLYHNLELIELPVMIPNEFMFDEYSKKYPEHKDKVEIYSEVAREIMCQCGGMQKSDKTFREAMDYYHFVSGFENKKKKLQ